MGNQHHILLASSSSSSAASMRPQRPQRRPPSPLALARPLSFPLVLAASFASWARIRWHMSVVEQGHGQWRPFCYARRLVSLLLLLPSLEPPPGACMSQTRPGPGPTHTPRTCYVRRDPLGARLSLALGNPCQPSSPPNRRPERKSPAGGEAEARVLFQ